MSEKIPCCLNRVIRNEYDGVTFEFYKDKNWIPCPPSRMHELGIWGNRVYFNPSLKVGALVTQRSARYPEFAVSANGLYFIRDAVAKAENIDRGFLVLVEYDWTPVINVIPENEILAALKDIPPRNDRGSEYWWIDEDGSPYTRVFAKDLFS
jgi:hypothetical protein